MWTHRARLSTTQYPSNTSRGGSHKARPFTVLYKHDVLGNMPNFGNKIDRTAICDGSGKVPTKE